MPRRDRSRYFTKSSITEILIRDNQTCIYCGKPATLVDHIISWELGGQTTKDNGVSCCKSCNKFKESDVFGNYIVKGAEYIARVKGKEKHG